MATKNILFITDAGASFYNKSYPVVKEAVPLLRKLDREGFYVKQVCPTASSRIMKKWLGQWSGDIGKRELSDHIRFTGIKLTGDEGDPIANDDKTVDYKNLASIIERFSPYILYIDTYPYIDGFNYHGLDYISYYAQHAEKIVWRVADPENETKWKSPLKSHFLEKHKDLIDKLFILNFSANPAYQDHYYPCPSMWYPHLYDPILELEQDDVKDIKFNNLKLTKFVGPIIYRLKIADQLDVINQLGKELNLRSEFYGEDYAKKSRFQGWSFEGKEYSNIDVNGKRVFLPGEDFYRFHSNMIFGMHDSTIKDLPDSSECSWEWSHKVFDVLYGGSILFSSPFFNSDNILGDAFNIKNIKDIVPVLYNSLFDNFDNYWQVVESQRARVNNTLGIDNWWNKIIENKVFEA